MSYFCLEMTFPYPKTVFPYPETAFLPPATAFLDTEMAFPYAETALSYTETLCLYAETAFSYAEMSFLPLETVFLCSETTFLHPETAFPRLKILPFYNKIMFCNTAGTSRTKNSISYALIKAFQNSDMAIPGVRTTGTSPSISESPLSKRALYGLKALSRCVI